ncbi:MAG: Eco57I restriction-modification methylase domain-containing protein, partial [Chloroflexi bacterium]|nr:Eco57I restriction-modification methylase domain-containing protein [Chloroflexota bacterium]
NQKQMGAYYTKEDITEYISKSTVVPFLFDAAEKKCAIAFRPEGAVWRLLRDDPDRYIYDAVKKGVDIPLPDDIAAGVADVSKRGGWNRPADDGLALPTETWREHVARRSRCLEVRGKLAAGEIHSINDLITYNLDLRQFAQDVIETSEGPDLLRAFYNSIEDISVLDPTCGSGAFLFAALNILEPLYEACLDRMEAFVEELDKSDEKHHPEKFSDFRKVLEHANDKTKHPSRRYFILKSIVLGNLYGVDIMAEAVEICKLRLFLKLVAQVERVEDVEPLPDIDFNIRAGNTLVGFTSLEAVSRAMTMGKNGQQRMVSAEEEATLKRIEEDAEVADWAFQQFRESQSGRGMDAGDFSTGKELVRESLRKLRGQLNRYLATEYGAGSNDQASYEKWRNSHQPFHWFVEFYGIMHDGGFDIIIGNPPYVEYAKVKNTYQVRSYTTEECGNLYALMAELSVALLRHEGRFGMIVPSSASCTDGFVSLQSILLRQHPLWVSSFSDQRGKLFDIPHPRLCIILYRKNRDSEKGNSVFTTSYTKLGGDGLRQLLFERLQYTNVATWLRPGVIPRYGTSHDHEIDSKVMAQERRIQYYVTPGSNAVYYTRKISWFVQVTPFVPKILDDRNHMREPSELKTITFSMPANAEIVFAALNSSLFYWFVTTGSDCRNLNMREVLGFPLNLDRLAASNQAKLRRLATQLADDLNVRSEFRMMSFKDVGQLNIQCLFPGRSKRIIDEIDSVLAKHYGFAEEELDYIINYDIKYRMGTGSDAEEE